MNTKRSIKPDNERRAYRILSAIRDYEKSLSAEEQEKMKRIRAGLNIFTR